MLQKNGKLYGALNALEEGDSNCWNSDAGDTQYFVIDFGGRNVTVHELRLQFQAGFSSEICRIEVQTTTSDGSWQATEEELEPSDSLELQSLSLEEPVTCQRMKVTFEDCTDFYGRITVYQLQTWGTEAELDTDT